MLGNTQTESNISKPVAIKQISVLFSKPIEFKMLVVIADKLIKSIKKAETVKNFPHSLLLKTKTPISSPQTANTGINTQENSAVNFNAF